MADVNLNISIKNNDKIIERNGKIVYTIVIINDGIDSAHHVTLTDKLPDALLNASFITSRGDAGTWNGSIDIGTEEGNGTSVVIVITGTLSNDAPRDIVNTALVIADEDLLGKSDTLTLTIPPIKIPCTCFGYRMVDLKNMTKTNLVTGKLTQIKDDIGIEVNCLAYNVKDQLIYAVEPISDGTTAKIYTIDGGGYYKLLDAVEHLPNGVAGEGTYYVGCADTNGHYFIRRYFKNSSNEMYVIDIDPDSPNYLHLVDPANGYQLKQGPDYNVNLQMSVDTGDWVFNPEDEHIYAVVTTGKVNKIDPITGEFDTLTGKDLPKGYLYGCQYIFKNSHIYAVSNDDGTIYRIILKKGDNPDEGYTNFVWDKFSQEQQSNGNDGTSCSLATLEVDFGDAPDNGLENQGRGSYRTLLASDGPRHAIITDEDGNPTLLLGEKVTGEDDAYQNNTATGDDIYKSIPDDGTKIPLEPYIDFSNSYKITETVLNNTGEDAYLYAWVDFNRDGIFQTNECFETTVQNLADIQTKEMEFTPINPMNVVDGETFVRVRITTDKLTNDNASDGDAEDTRSYGPAGDGEVEDYLLFIKKPKLEIDKFADKESVCKGENITYTITIKNIGDMAVNNVVVSDPIPEGTSFVEESINVISDSGEVIVYDPEIEPYITIKLINAVKINETITITFQVLVN